ncbi:MAG TPA: DUF5615 family PIN-like protein [Gemmataceae bacterium]|nr:DUF5615 family PIN-like protein [Gemmataceae bacterium]
MNVLDENIPESQRALLRSKRVVLRQIGRELGRKGMQDDEIIPLLHQLDRPTLFTLDGDFYDRRLCHEEYCVVYLDVEEERAADYVRRLLRHRELNTKAKRMGCVIRVLPTGLIFWRIHQVQESHLSWK